ncbi:hypothetical protein TeGR_g13053, partial [Tetraparma gracilis]
PSPPPQFFIVRWYYQNYYFFGACCIGAEMTYMLAFAMFFNPVGVFWYPLQHNQAFYVFLPFCACKNVVNFFQLCSASKEIARSDAFDWNEANIKGYKRPPFVDPDAPKKE